jgi:hypothetical protein
VLEVFKELEIRSHSRSALETFLSDLALYLPKGWKRDRVAEKDLEDVTPSYSDDSYVISVSRKKRKYARIFLFKSGLTAKITNIVPAAVGQLSRSQYNAIVQEFAGAIASPARALGLNLSISGDREDVLKSFGAPAGEALRKFSRGANKSTGSSHPSDKKRWIQFLIAAHLQKSEVSSSTLMRWLVEEEKWPEDMANDLAIQYEFSSDLLESYDQQ